MFGSSLPNHHLPMPNAAYPGGRQARQLIRSRRMTPHLVRRSLQAFEVPGYGLVLAPDRESEMLMVRFRRTATWPFVHHEIPAACLDRVLESVDGLHDVEQLLWPLGTAQSNPELREPPGQLPGNPSQLVVLSRVGVVRSCHWPFSLVWVFGTVEGRQLEQAGASLNTDR